MKHLFRFSLLLLALLLPAAAAAHDFEVGGIYYNINGDEATVTFRGTYTHSYSDEYTGDVAIPSAVTYSGTTYAVTAIGESALKSFYDRAYNTCTVSSETALNHIWSFMLRHFRQSLPQCLHCCRIKVINSDRTCNHLIIGNH